jgi:hypothetical protein
MNSKIEEISKIASQLPGYQEIPDEDGRHSVIVDNAAYIVEVLISRNWLGLKFDLKEDGKKSVGYEIDTDLYDISKPENYSFREEICNDILSFLGALKSGKVQAGHNSSKKVILIPSNDRFILISKNRFFTTKKIVYAKRAAYLKNVHPL